MTNLFQTAVIGAAVVVAFASSVRGECVCCTADGTQYYADDLHGNDAFTGLCEQKLPDPSTCGPKRTIQAALNLASAGDVVNVLPGEYISAATLEMNQDCVTLRGLGEVVVGAGISPAIRISTPTGARVEGLTFRFPNFVNSRFMNIENSSDVIIQRCRFIDGWGSVFIQTSINTTFRECLFLRQRQSAHPIQIASGPVFVDRCTLAWNVIGLGGSGLGFFKNTISFGNGGVGVGNFSNCSFYGPGEGCPSGTNITCDVDPLFIDGGDPFDAANNLGRDIFYLTANSPVLNEGEDGQPIGAFGQGFHTSKDLSKDEGVSTPSQGGTPWAAWRWVDGSGTLLLLNHVNSPVEFNEQNEVLLKEPVTSAALYSPVFDTGSQFTVIRSVDFAAFEDTTPLPGLREIVDADASTSRRELNIRTSMTSFVQDPSTGPVFEAVDKRVKLRIRAQFVQMELVLRRDGN